MPGDYTRKIFDRKKHYSGVLMQQGRVQLDADWNEQLDIELYHDRTEAVDVIGPCGVPKDSDAFQISVSAGDLSISPGHIYVDGLLCELDGAASYTNQPYYIDPEFVKKVSSPPASPPNSKKLSLADGTYLVYLDAWEREITARDDSLLGERALGGPDTTTRLQTVWQVRLLPVSAKNASPPGSPTCDTSFPEYDTLIAASSGMMNARTQADPQKEPCSLPPTAGYFGLENQLYRVEVQKGGPLSSATFKWSRENGSVETLIKNISGKAITVHDLGRDDVLGFAGGQWVEIVDEASSLDSNPRSLFQVDFIDPQNIQVILKTAPVGLGTLTNPKLKRWDQTGSDATPEGIPMSPSRWISLENGVEVKLLDGNYHAGDYWLIPARTQGNEIEWPPFEIPNTNPAAQLPIGVQHHFCRLAIIQVSKGAILDPPDDCRESFPPLTHICADDVCYDNSKCGLPDTQTVQDALDRLCAERDLRRHNKYLHGWGIVCGLQVFCGPDNGGIRRHVTVKPGYAIDCDGNDINLDSDIQVDVLREAAAVSSPPLS
ncbi:MAG TPA: DUF6519 domain-containing protein, partial [Blastocatellia bacterium]|nr:DUF6519 domain-containing protein [Blastocatellia bacterium]